MCRLPTLILLSVGDAWPGNVEITITCLEKAADADAATRELLLQLCPVLKTRE